MFNLAMEVLVDLLDDAMDEILGGDPSVYTAEERTRFFECYEHWLTTGFTGTDIVFLRAQLESTGQ